MSFTKKLRDEFNDQMNAEFESAYLYLSMAIYFNKVNLDGFASWMRRQYDEEREHALKFFDFILERNEVPELDEFKKPKNDWDSPLDAFKDALKHEKYITDRINKLMGSAIEEKDYASQTFLHWFIDEQVEEENSVQAIIDQLEIAKENPSALFFLNAELGKRISSQSED